MHAAFSRKRAIEIALSAAKEKGISLEAAEVKTCYLPSYPGIPLIYAVTLRDSNDRIVPILIHALSGRVISSGV